MKIQHQQILNATARMGIIVKNISDIMGCDAAILETAKKRELVVRGTPTSLINSRSQHYCDNKQLTKTAFETLQIPYPQSVMFRDIEDPNLYTFFQENKTYVCKPIDGTNGVGVEMNINSYKAIENYWNKHQVSGNTFILEEQIEGNDLRIQVVGGKIVAVCTRIPAFIIGDGVQTVAHLAKQLQSKTRANNPANDFVIDETTEQLLSKQRLTLQSIPSVNQRIQLKKVANMAQGAIALDLTDALHPDFQLWVDQLVDYLDCGYFGIDIIALDYRQPPSNGAWLLEINARPEWLHHTFSQGKQHDIAKIVLTELFEKKSIS